MIDEYRTYLLSLVVKGHINPHLSGCISREKVSVIQEIIESVGRDVHMVVSEGYGVFWKQR